MAKHGGKGLVQWQPRTAPPELAEGSAPLLFEKNTYEADKSLKRIFEVASRPLTKQKVHGKQVSASCLLGKDANHKGVTFTAQMQPKIEPGQSLDIFFRCSELVELWVVKQFGQPKSLTKPSAFVSAHPHHVLKDAIIIAEHLQVILKERQEDGKWVEIGQTESVPKSSDPAFSVSIKVKYKGPDVVQHMHVQVFSYAFKMPNGVPMGDCYFILDDLVHSRTARVMKLPITSPDHQRTNGSITITGTQRVEVEDGVWMQIHFAADRLFGSTRPRASKALPQTFFEIWRQNEDGIVQVYRSETKTTGSVRTEWWPFALSGKRIGASSDSQLIVKMFDAGAGESGEGQFLGETRLSLGECRAGKSFPIMEEWRAAGSKHVAEGQPAFVVEDCKWIKIKDGGMLETQPAYHKDLVFLKDLMDNMELDAASKEAIGTCMLFVRNRAMYWSMHDIVSASCPLPPARSPLPAANYSRPPSALDAMPLSPLPVRSEEAHLPPAPAPELSYAEDVEAAVHRLTPQSPLSNREINQIWKHKLQQLGGGEGSPSNVERMGKRFSVDLVAEDVQTISESCKAQALTPHAPRSPPPRPPPSRPATAGRARGVPASSGRRGFDLGDLTRIGARAAASTAAGPAAPDPPSLRPQSARFPPRDEAAPRRRPETARARMDGPRRPLSARNHWRPSTARSESGPLSARSRPSTARSLTCGSGEGSPPSVSASIEAVARTVELRQSIRPLLSALMRHGSACQHPSYVAPVSQAGLTPAGKFRFTRGLI